MKRVILTLLVIIPFLSFGQAKLLKMPTIPGDQSPTCMTYVLGDVKQEHWEAIHIYAVTPVTTNKNAETVWRIFYDNSDRNSSEPLEMEVIKKDFKEVFNGTKKYFLAKFRTGGALYEITTDAMSQVCIMEIKQQEINKPLPFTKRFELRYLDGKKV